MKRIVVAFFALTLGGCVTAEGQIVDREYAQYLQAFHACGAKFRPIDARVAAVAYMECVNTAEALMHWRYPDIQNRKARARVAIGERVQRGLITEKEGLAEAARSEEEAETEATRRSAAEAVAGAALLQTERPRQTIVAPAPRHCHTQWVPVGINGSLETYCD